MKFWEVLKYVRSDAKVKAYAWKNGECRTYFGVWNSKQEDDFAPCSAWGYDMAILLADYNVVGISSEGEPRQIEFTLVK